MQAPFAFLNVGPLFALLGWMQPLHILPWVSWHSEVPVFAAVLLVAGSALFASRRAGKSALPLPLGVWWLLAILAVVVVQAVTGVIHFAGDAVVLTLYLALCIYCWLLGYHALAANDGPQGVSWSASVAWTLLAAALFSAALALVQVFEVWEHLSWINRMPQPRRPGANVGQPNQLGTLLLMGLASLIYLRESGRLHGPTSLLTTAFIALALVATESRTAVLSIILLALWCLAGYVRCGLKTKPSWVIAALLALLALYWLWPALIALTEPGGFAAGQPQVNTKPGMRLVVWPQLLEAVGQRPWLGWGIREVAEAHNAVVHAHDVAEPYTYAHNLLLDAALGMGLPLTLLALAAASFWAYRRVKGSTNLLAWYCLAAVLPVAVHSMLEFPFAYAYFLAPVMVLLGMLDATVKARTVGTIGLKTAAAATLLMAATGVWTVVEYVQIEEDFRVARFEAMRVGLTPQEYERPTVRLLTQLEALLEAARVRPKSAMTSEQIDALRSVALRYPWPATQSRYALALVLNGQEQEGLRQLKVIHVMHGDANYQQIKADWKRLGDEQYPQLLVLDMP